MKIKRKYSRKAKPEQDTPLDTGPASAPVASANAPAESFTPNDLNGVETDKPKRKYSKRANSDAPALDFGKLMVFAGQTVAKLASIVTKQDAPINQTETEMLDAIGKSCGAFLIDQNQLDEAAQKYAKYVVLGGLGLVVGVRALDYFTRPRLTAGKPSAIAYDASPHVVDMDAPDIQG